MVLGGEFVVEQHIVRFRRRPSRDGAQDLGVLAGRLRLLDYPQEVSGIGNTAGLPQQHLGDHRAQVCPGLHVVGDVRNPTRGEVARHAFQQVLGARNPGVDAVGDDVVEPALVEVAQIGLHDGQVGQRGYRVLGTSHRGGRQVDSHERGVRGIRGEGGQIPGVGTTDLQHASHLRIRRLQTTQMRDDRHPVRLGLSQRDTGVGDLVVRSAHLVRVTLTGAAALPSLFCA